MSTYGSWLYAVLILTTSCCDIPQEDNAAPEPDDPDEFQQDGMIMSDMLKKIENLSDSIAQVTLREMFNSCLGLWVDNCVSFTLGPCCLLGNARVSDWFVLRCRSEILWRTCKRMYRSSKTVPARG